jgi:hypothetical protein
MSATTCQRPALYSVWITDRHGAAHYRTVRSSLGAPQVRIAVQRRAVAEFGEGFKFSVRPL